MALVSSSLKKMVVLVFMISISASSVRTALADDTYQAVLAESGEDVLYGAGNTFTVWNVDTGIGYLQFFFGLGFPGNVVQTDVQLTMGFIGDASRIYACQDNGSMVTVPVSSVGTPQESLIRVRYNATDGYYRLQITEETPVVYVQFVLLSQGALLCTRGAAGSRLKFQLTSASSTSTADKPVVVHAHNNMQIPHISTHAHVSRAN